MSPHIGGVFKIWDDKMEKYISSEAQEHVITYVFIPEGVNYEITQVHGIMTYGSCEVKSRKYEPMYDCID